jgi:VanZ family protein
MKLKNMKTLIPVMVSLSLMATIFILSGQSGDVSTKLSVFFSRLIAKAIFFDYDSMPPQTQEYIVGELHAFTRKLAHFTAYALLGFAIFMTLHNILKRLSAKVVLSVVICAVYASADELHQLFVPGRAGKPLDVAIDISGAVCGIIAALVVLALGYCVKHRKRGL